MAGERPEKPRKVSRKSAETVSSRRTGSLSPRERQIAELLARGMVNKQIAAELSLSTATVSFRLLFNLVALSQYRMSRGGEWS